MKAYLPAALIGALMVSPAFAAGAQKSDSSAQSSPSMSSPGMSGQAQSGQASGQHDSQTIRQVQQKLQQEGYQVGEIDGKMGPQTKQALENFQRDKNLQGAGELDQQTIAALGVDSGSSSQQAETPSSAAPGGSSGSGTGTGTGIPGAGGMDSSGRSTTDTNSSDMNPRGSSAPPTSGSR